MRPLEDGHQHGVCHTKHPNENGQQRGSQPTLGSFGSLGCCQVFAYRHGPN
jgi:hypothetical protein